MKIRYYTMTHLSSNGNQHRIEPPIDRIQLSLSSWLLRPYLDLGNPGGSIQARVTAFIGESLIHEEEPSFQYQINTNTMLRPLLFRERGLTHYNIVLPVELPEHLRTPSWHVLCEQLARWPSLSSEQKVKVATVLNKLGLYKAALHYIPLFSAAEIATDQVAARLAIKRANALFKIDARHNVAEVEKTFCQVAMTALGDRRIRLTAAINLVVHHARLTKDIVQMQRWAEVAEKEFRGLQLNDTLNDHLLISCYYRGMSFIPFFLEKKTTVVSMMDEAEAHARLLFQNPYIPEILAAENLHPLLETRAKEATWLGDNDLALDRLQQLIAHDPLEPKVHIRLGDFLFKLQQTEAALACYRQAAYLGVPYTTFAWFMAAQCYKKLGALELACDAYIQSLKTDPWNISALVQLHDMSEQLDLIVLRQWSEERLQGFRQRSRVYM